MKDFLLLDMRGKKIQVSDHVVDERGKVYVAVATEHSFLREGLIRVLPLNAKGKPTQNHTYLRVWHIFVGYAFGSFGKEEQRQREKEEQALREIEKLGSSQA